MANLLQRFTFDRNTLKRDEAQSSSGVFEALSYIRNGTAINGKADSNIIGAFTSYIGLARKTEAGALEATDLADVFERLYAKNGLDAWRWLLTRALFKYTVPNGTQSHVNDAFDSTQATERRPFCFFKNLIELLVIAQGQPKEKRFVYYDELLDVMAADESWFISSIKLWERILLYRSHNAFLAPADRPGLLGELEDTYNVSRDNLNTFFNKALSQTGLFEYQTTSSGKKIGIALKAIQEPALQERLRYIFDNDPIWNQSIPWAAHLAWKSSDLPEKVTPADVQRSVSSHRESLLDFSQDIELPYGRQVLIHGSPGSGKSYQVNRWAEEAAHSIRTVFFPETTYADFVGVYRPRPVYKEDKISTFVNEEGQRKNHGEPFITYEFVPGPLIRAYCFAKQNPGKPVALIIEELSRGNASAIFGDMLQLLDRDQKHVSTYGVIPRSEIRSFLSQQGISESIEDEIRLPSNLYIWATMNRSDQSARQLDAAFLRRWEKQYLSYDAPCSYGQSKVDVPGGQDITWDELRHKINTPLKLHVSEDRLIGPYFLSSSTLSERNQVAEDLLGYLWNDVLKSRHSLLFRTATFSEAMTAWKTGSSNPFKDLQFE